MFSDFDEKAVSSMVGELAVSHQLSGKAIKNVDKVMRDFRELKVWQKAHELVLVVYQESGHFPKHETYGLITQLRRAAVSIAANISEGAGKNSRSDFARFLQISLGSASEVEYELLLAHDLGYLNSEAHARLETLVIEIKKMLTGFIQHLQVSRTGSHGPSMFLKADG